MHLKYLTFRQRTLKHYIWEIITYKVWIFEHYVQAQKLTFVSLRDSPITNVESFQRCRHLSFLSLEGNEISDISMIRGLKNIKSIDLYGNPLQDCPVKE